ncbi:hypothetical protein niasHS_005854 [Heterodera schachtii]|uniref:Elongation of very long chain fatty acids protein n=1 Tax=Heterodera schachtii TaxID=97005 RepID=A0ABD2JZM0_HETSC
MSSLINLFNSFEMYHENNTRNMHSSYKHKFQFPYERIEDPAGLTTYFQKYWHQTITIGILYYVIIKSIEWAMRDRKPFDLRNCLFVWNTALALFSICGFIRVGEESLINLIYEGFTFTICHTVNARGPGPFWGFLFFLSKFAEFGDTLFIVLRKKRLIFLHYYHHAAVLIYSAHVGAEHTAASSLFLPMNFFAHSLMYSYYALNSLGFKLPRWFAMVVTTVQTTQMLFGVAITATVFKLKVFDGARCQQSMGNLYLAIFLYSTFAVLFIKFFYAAYLRKEKKRKAGQKKVQ